MADTYLTMSELFAGIGGFSLGFRRAGFRVVWQVEIDPFCRRVLKKNFPESERFNDVREVGKHNLKAVDVICGGFPCQDISYAGKGAGIDGRRSGLWSEYARIIGELRPRFVVVENVPALLTRGIDRVTGDLAAIGYDAEWRVISAADAGAPHLRERIWILAYPSGRRFRGAVLGEMEQSRRAEIISRSEDVADTFVEQWNGRMYWTCRWTREPEEALRDAWRGRGEEDGVPIVKPELGRVAYGIPNRVDRLRALGNAVVPQISQWIAHNIANAITRELAD